MAGPCLQIPTSGGDCKKPGDLAKLGGTECSDWGDVVDCNDPISIGAALSCSSNLPGSQHEPFSSIAARHCRASSTCGDRCGGALPDESSQPANRARPGRASTNCQRARHAYGG